MKFIDLNDDRVYTLQDLHRDWAQFRQEDPENHAPDFKTELFEILMATINGRNDLEILGMTHLEISSLTLRLQPSLIQKLCPQAKGQAADFPVCHAEDFEVVPSVDGRHQDFEELDFEAVGMVLRVFLPKLCPVAVQVLQGVNPVVVQVDELHGVYLLLDLRACGSG